MPSYCVDFDDMCSAVMYHLDILLAIKQRTPKFKATLFTIPKRITSAEVDELKQHSWLALAPHGWRHTKGECLAWTSDEAKDKLLMSAELGIDAPIFKAPAWLVDGETYEACRELNYAVASHHTFRVPHTGVPEYIYSIRNKHKCRGIHAHLTKCAGLRTIKDLYLANELTFDDSIEFYFAHEVAQVVTYNPGYAS